MITLVFAILFALAFLAVCIYAFQIKKLKKEIEKIVTLEDDAPQRKEKEKEFIYKRRCVLKLQDDIIKSNALVVKEGKVELKVFVEQ